MSLEVSKTQREHARVQVRLSPVCMCTLGQVRLQAPSEPDRRDFANGIIASYTLNVLGTGRVIWDGN